ncbi:MAG: winged helix-turn-helix transcriptional regulator, partial [Ktedonobacterales bacterium]
MSHTVRRIVRSMNARDVRGANGLGVSQRGADGAMMREMNRFLVLNCVREQGPIARVSIAQRTGLSRTTVSSIIETLIKEGFVREGSLLDAAPTGGRRAILV